MILALLRLRFFTSVHTASFYLRYGYILLNNCVITSFFATLQQFSVLTFVNSFPLFDLRYIHSPKQNTLVHNFMHSFKVRFLTRTKVPGWFEFSRLTYYAVLVKFVSRLAVEKFVASFVKTVFTHSNSEDEISTPIQTPNPTIKFSSQFVQASWVPDWAIVKFSPFFFGDQPDQWALNVRRYFIATNNKVKVLANYPNKFLWDLLLSPSNLWFTLITVPAQSRFLKVFYRGKFKHYKQLNYLPGFLSIIDPFYARKFFKPKTVIPPDVRSYIPRPYYGRFSGKIVYDYLFE